MSAGHHRSHLEALLRAGEFVVTSELQTTDGADPGEVHALAEGLAGRVDAVNCTDNAAAHPHLGVIAAGHLVADRGVEPIVQLACRDRNRIALQADLLAAAALGAPNVVVMTGDDVAAGDHPETKPIYDLDSLHLLRIARIMRDEGTYLNGRPLSTPPSFFLGAVENPFAPPFEYRPIRLEKKIEAGAEFFQSQIVFNLPRMREFLAECGDLGLLERTFLLASVYVPRSARALRYMGERVPGIDVPEEVVARMDGVPPDRQPEEGVALAIETIASLRELPGIAGVHLISIGSDEVILRAIEGAGLLPRPRIGEGSASG